MNSREKFLATMNFESVDSIPLWESGYWVETIRRWYKEGLPRCIGFEDGPDVISLWGELMIWDASQGPHDRDVHLEFGLDEGLRRVPINSFIHPLYERRVLEDDGEVVTEIDERGHIARHNKDNSSIVQIVKAPVETREDWEKIKAERLQPTLEGRLPVDWEQQRELLRDRDFALCIGGYGGQAGFFDAARWLMGPEPLFCGFYEQPDLVRDILNHMADLQTSLFDQVLSQIDVDFASFTEDIGYNAGPLIGPATFREFVLPCYKKITNMLRDHGVKIILIDSDGDNWKLIPDFIEGGATGLYPMEVAAKMDVWEIRQAYPRLQMLGGIDKRAVAKGKQAIDRELEKKVPQTLASGGYIPTVDHQVPPDISWENFVYYRKRLEEMVRGR